MVLLLIFARIGLIMSATEKTTRFLASALRGVDVSGLSVRLWDGTEWSQGKSSRKTGTLVLNHPGALKKMFLSPGELSLGEAYIYGDFDIEGDIQAILELGVNIMTLRWDAIEKARYAAMLLTLPGSGDFKEKHAASRKGQLHSKVRDRDSVSFAYDISNDFFSLFLDERMLYSCAYFKKPSDSLDKAQLQKLDLVCRKLNLKKGEKLLDLGCGWGALGIHAVKYYGATSHGVTLSKEQAKFANDWIKKEGIGKQCKIEVRDYRDIPQKQQYDKIGAIGVMEHIGKDQLPGYFESVRDLMRPGGLILCHGIATNGPDGGGASPFTQKYIFPDGDPANAASRLTAAIDAGLEVWDIDNLREHYVLTASHWLMRLERNRKKIIEIKDEIFYRIAWIGLAGGYYRFSSGANALIQGLYYKPDKTRNNPLPLLKEPWYK